MAQLAGRGCHGCLIWSGRRTSCRWHPPDEERRRRPDPSHARRRGRHAPPAAPHRPDIRRASELGFSEPAKPSWASRHGTLRAHGPPSPAAGRRATAARAKASLAALGSPWGETRWSSPAGTRSRGLTCPCSLRKPELGSNYVSSSAAGRRRPRRKGAKLHACPPATTPRPALAFLVAQTGGAVSCTTCHAAR